MSNTEVEDDYDEVIEFEEDFNASLTNTLTPTALLRSVQNGIDRVRSFTVDEFIHDAFRSATMLRNMLGDADGVVAEQTEAIRSNLIVVLTEVRKDPAEFIISIALAMPVDLARSFVDSCIAKLEEFRSHLTDG